MSSYSEEEGAVDDVLVVHVIKAEGLAKRDRGKGKSDPYAAVRYRKQELKTRVMKRTLNPVWDEVLEFEPDDHGDVIEVDLWDDDKVGEDYLGRVVIAERLIPRGGVPDEQWFDVRDKRGRRTEENKGRLLLRFGWTVGGVFRRPYYANRDNWDPDYRLERDPAYRAEFDAVYEATINDVLHSIHGSRMRRGYPLRGLPPSHSTHNREYPGPYGGYWPGEAGPSA
ncbi:uncharacterized protein AMSG_01743 [Thecamonas trahens ATCC 50062]|uniref:C2 domain-containing protein n=1 Tax=Thecamonas trahens ATCC 50062 TaxID=461836 RepID=A0A0L0DT00_THETB|nr:hypothetical protein AMSG_01743 [Thecamonas trahens ATCC 50062]KNC55479.1 hypothetical protein AMSG_01743 [Thecamonas trahens ATCC 50062]|eukprot:XP_013761259.1 hypothetical protein AMSG_01743 [Thecamonas trahens ATCC 50062]